MRVVTLGAYGFSAETFFEKLRSAGVDTFCDIRWRRGVRGKEYAFANHQRLRRRLDELGIHYHHFRELAPAPGLRKLQVEADQAAGIAKRQRTVLGAVFAGAYVEALAHFDSRAFVKKLGEQARVAALFCVEREPSACHRSLLAERLKTDLGAEIEVAHLVPDP